LAQESGINWRHLVTVVSVLILIGTEVFGVAFAAGWAIAGLFELGSTIGYVLMGLFSLLGVYALLALWRRSVAVEPITGRSRA
jgi:hypothetical protein